MTPEEWSCEQCKSNHGRVFEWGVVFNVIK